MEITVTFSREEYERIMIEAALKKLEQKEIMVFDSVRERYGSHVVEFHKWTKEDEPQQAELPLPGVNVNLISSSYGPSPFESTE